MRHWRKWALHMQCTQASSCAVWMKKDTVLTWNTYALGTQPVAWSFSRGSLPAHTSSYAYTPCRFYIMRLPSGGVAFDRITYHAQVTQCLGSLGEQPWFLVVAEPSGSVEAWPQLSDLHAFRCASWCPWPERQTALPLLLLQCREEGLTGMPQC